jgi:hypothetical protein
MLLFLHQPYPDELFYSFCARYHMMSRNLSPKDTIQDLFGVKSACAVFDLPNRLNIFYSRLPEDSTLTPDYIIRSHTLFPAFQPFLPLERAQRIYESMQNTDQGGSIHSRSGIMASAIPSLRFLRYCLECIRDDESKFGEPYWHRVHQITGVLICPIHRRWLKESPNSVFGGINKQLFCVLSQNQADKELKSPEYQESLSKYLFISRAVAWLLNNRVDSLGLDIIRQKYLDFLRPKDLCTFSGKIRQRELLNEFIGFYGSGFLRIINCQISKSQDNWLSKMVRKPRGTTHPLHHLLLMCFLGITPEEFFKPRLVPDRPFGEGPWPCLNPTAPHYHRDIIKNVEITLDSKQKVPVGNFKCSCGFAYSRRGPDREVNDRYRVGRIKSFGPMWDQKLLHMTLSGNFGLRETARVLNVDPKTIKKQLLRLRVQVVSNRTISPNSNIETKSYKQAEWMQLVNQNPEKSRTELRSLSPSLYTWLYRHDRSWLDEHLPPVIRKSVNNNRVNWNELDDQIVEKIKTAVNKIIQKAEPGRLTNNAIGKEAGVQMFLQKHLDKLPKSRELLDMVTETVEEFQCVRVRYITKKLKENDEIIRPWKIIRHAGLPNEISPRVINEIETIMAMERDLQ